MNLSELVEPPHIFIVKCFLFLINLCMKMSSWRMYVFPTFLLKRVEKIDGPEI